MSREFKPDALESDISWRILVSFADTALRAPNTISPHTRALPGHLYRFEPHFLVIDGILALHYEALRRSIISASTSTLRMKSVISDACSAMFRTADARRNQYAKIMKKRYAQWLSSSCGRQPNMLTSLLTVRHL